MVKQDSYYEGKEYIAERTPDEKRTRKEKSLLQQVSNPEENNKE